ncbi:MAG: hypothetical protein KGH61_01580 [Candidatus Micrarchaeota archaeon]|nr:hypothetical protein [Candidatus Micrarchaeota archaeon]MDE1847622.1 hypothetical protein [Candidatus Micrarchaeota archaeon]MDE1863825.1 hypothetical protein [Candidatus Micrarchaeota archaeon]
MATIKTKNEFIIEKQDFGKYSIGSARKPLPRGLAGYTGASIYKEIVRYAKTRTVVGTVNDVRIDIEKGEVDAICIKRLNRSDMRSKVIHKNGKAYYPNSDGAKWPKSVELQNIKSGSGVLVRRYDGYVERVEFKVGKRK